MNDLYYVLDGHEPRPTTFDGWVEWSKATGKDGRRVAETTIGEAWVSTVFLWIDHNYWGGPKPILFETMIFGGPHAESQWRYSTWDEAVAGHERVVAALKEGRDPDEE